VPAHPFQISIPAPCFLLLCGIAAHLNPASQITDECDGKRELLPWMVR
jgi:hypothetical protein